MAITASAACRLTNARSNEKSPDAAEEYLVGCGGGGNPLGIAAERRSPGPETSCLTTSVITVSLWGPTHTQPVSVTGVRRVEAALVGSRGARAAGWDGVVVHGASPTPVYLWIKDDKVEFRDATRYWGKLTGEVQDGIEAELGDRRVRTLQCGVAGERGVRFAAIVNQLKHFHGRGGLGAVMGSKKLKAIVVRGSKPPAATDKDGAKKQLVYFKDHYDRATDRFHHSSLERVWREASGIRDGNFRTARRGAGHQRPEDARHIWHAVPAAWRRVQARGEVREIASRRSTAGPSRNPGRVGSPSAADLKAGAHQPSCSAVRGRSISARRHRPRHGATSTHHHKEGGARPQLGHAIPSRARHPNGKREGSSVSSRRGVKRAAKQSERPPSRSRFHGKARAAMPDPRGEEGLDAAYALVATGASHGGPHDPLTPDSTARYRSAAGLIERSIPCMTRRRCGRST